MPDPGKWGQGWGRGTGALTASVSSWRTMGQYVRPSGSEAVELGHVGVRGLDVGPASLSTGSFGISSGKVAEGPDWLLCVTGRDKGWGATQDPLAWSRLLCEYLPRALWHFLAHREGRWAQPLLDPR